jgi:hypothetical protein
LGRTVGGNLVQHVYTQGLAAHVDFFQAEVPDPL